MAKTEVSYVEKFLATYSGKELVKKYNMGQYGVWQVFGEDPNCDFGGSHSMPNLGTYEGALGDIIEMAVDLPRFWTWGAGGDIRMIAVKKVDKDTTKRKAELESAAKELQLKLKAINKELESL